MDGPYRTDLLSNFSRKRYLVLEDAVTPADIELKGSLSDLIPAMLHANRLYE